jgi:outer membrane cobalamin receptor
VQTGTKGTLSIRNNNYTLGYTFNDAKYATQGVQTFKSGAERAYVDTRHKVGSTLLGATVEYEKYSDFDQNQVSLYSLTSFDSFDVGFRLSEDAFVYRLGTEFNDWYASLGTSYRNPTLYELNGDSWTQPNPTLEPEEAIGYEIGYKNITVFKYKFSEGIDYSYSDSSFVNTGSYDTHGVRYNNSMTFDYLDTFIGYELGYTDSDQPRVAKYKVVVSSVTDLGPFVISFRYTGLFDREPSLYDGTESLDNVSSLDYKLETVLSPNYLLSFTIRDILDNEFEYIPNYSSGGLEYFITLQYRP